MATQNPLEQEGTYPLPEAQLDRFLLQIDIGYPGSRCRTANAAGDDDGARSKRQAGCSAEGDLQELQNLVRRMPISEKTVEGILSLVRNGRPETHRSISSKNMWCGGRGRAPRKPSALPRGARALLDGRLSPSLDDVFALAKPALQHRMALSFSARAEGVTMDEVLQAMTQSIA